jgi:hypothetical protein
MKHVVMFSGGAASAVTAWIVAGQVGKKNMILLHTPTFSEHPDADRFREQVAAHIGVPVTIMADGRNIWELIASEHCLPSYWIPFCTRILKIEQTDKYIKTLNEDFILYYGYGPDEWRRIQKQTARFSVKGIKTAYPLAEQKITGEMAKTMIVNEWKICLPEPYQHLKHNNCLPCFKGGKNHFRTIAKYYPEYFQKAMEAENMIGHTVFRDCSLADISAQAQGGDSLFDDDDIPCMCAY